MADFSHLKALGHPEGRIPQDVIYMSTYVIVFGLKIFLDCPGMLYRPSTGDSWSKLECTPVERNYLGE